MCDSRFSAKSSLYVHIKKHQSKAEPLKKDVSYKNPPKVSLSSSKQKKSNSSNDLAHETELQTKIISREILSQSDQPSKNSSKGPISKALHHCPVDTCKRSYTSKAALRSHLVKMHGTPEKEVPPPKTDSTLSVSNNDNTDYIVYTPYSISQNDQMIMVSPCDAVFFSSSETDVLLQPEPPRQTSVLKRKQPQQGKNHRRRDQGSARTGLTYADVSKLKAHSRHSESAVGATDVILGSADLEEGLLLTEDLPSSLYFQDDIGGECQVLLLDSGVVGNTINLRDLV